MADTVDWLVNTDDEDETLVKLQFTEFDSSGGVQYTTVMTPDVADEIGDALKDFAKYARENCD